MEEHSVVKKRSVAELAGKFNCPIPHTTDAEVNKPVRRRPPRTLPLPANNDAGQGQDEKGAETASPRKNRNSALIEKLQANLALSPTGPLPFSKNPGVLKLPMPSFSPGSPSSPSSPPVTVTPKQEETPASFENPSEGPVLKSIIKSRARHSIKRRPPSRRHRKSSADEEVDKTASDTLEHTTPNGHEGDVFEEQKPSLDTESLSSKEQIEQETKSTDSEKAEPEEKVETVTSEKKEAEEKTEQEEEKTEQKEEKTEQEEEKTEQKEEKTEQEEEKTEQKEEKTEQEEEKTEQEEEKTEQEEEKTEQELKEEKSEAEPQLANSTEETHEEPVTETHGKPQAEPDTTDEKEEEQKEDEVNH
ncbi:duboraya isoform X1 [Ctenopharyngodon idella]|uniref:duboraya isoform X1 n=1 Tax=Ctenopharyngodon idella TaxID=7959 RepID=UPI0022317155|nr:duboraya isoform X1 [Ctenopharyngodon idella]